MKIQLVQSEIEQAISNYIRETITVNEGMSITMELRATRGAEGFQADIDISRTSDDAVAKVAPVAPVTRTASKTATVGQPIATTRSKPAETLVEPEPATEAVTAEDPGTVGQAEEEVGKVEDAGQPAEEQAAVAQPTAEAAPKRSLFAGLKKPVNPA